VQIATVLDIFIPPEPKELKLTAISVLSLGESVNFFLLVTIQPQEEIIRSTSIVSEETFFIIKECDNFCPSSMIPKSLSGPSHSRGCAA
jgi:hypothetical protein